MAQGTLEDAINYARRNPKSDFARQLRIRIDSGAADAEAAQLGIDLTPFGRPAPVVEPVKPSIRNIGSQAAGAARTAGGQIRDAFKSGASRAVEGFRDQQQANNPIELIEGGMKTASGVVQAATSPLAPAVAPIGRQIEKAADRISDTKPFKEYGEGSVGTEGDMATRVLEDVTNATDIAGAFAGVKGAGKVPGAAQKGMAIAEEGIGIGADATKGAMQTAGSAISGTLPSPRAVLNNAGDVAETLLKKPVPPQFEKVLRETPSTQFDMYADAAQKAATDLKQPTPLEVAGTRAQVALKTIQERLFSAGRKKEDFMKIGGGSITPIRGEIVRDFYRNLQSFLNSKTAIEGDTKLLRDITAEARKLGATPAAGQVDRFIDFVQDKIYTSGRELSIPVSDGTTSFLRGAVGKLNEALKKQMPEKYRELNSEYSRLIDIRNELNTKLGKEGEKGGALMKRVFSPSDANTKKLFEEVLAETGIDLINEATLAKYVMEAVGDVRQISMLEELSLPRMSKTGMLDYLKEFLAQRYNTPEAQLRRAREMTTE